MTATIELTGEVVRADDSGTISMFLAQNTYGDPTALSPLERFGFEMHES